MNEKLVRRVLHTQFLKVRYTLPNSETISIGKQAAKMVMAAIALEADSAGKNSNFSYNDISEIASIWRGSLFNQPGQTRIPARRGTT
jgi:hypothetical protein